MHRPLFVGLDFDGVVIAGSNQGYFDCYHKALESVGVSLDPNVERERIVEGWGRGHIQQFQILLAEYPDRIEAAAKVWEEGVESEDFWKHVHLIEGSKEAIERMSREVPVAIVSGTRTHHIHRMLEREGVQGVSAVFSSYDVESALRKPHPYTLQLALGKFACPANQAIYVGDMRNDIVMARAAGVEPVAVLTGELTRETASAEGVSLIEQNLLGVAQRLFP